MRGSHQTIDYRRVLNNPSSAYRTPEDVLIDPRLRREEKQAVLSSWEQDERELSVAQEEGMPGNGGRLLRRVLMAQAYLSPRCAAAALAATKHGGTSAVAWPMLGRSAFAVVRDVMRVVDEVVHIDHSVQEAAMRMQRLDVPFLAVVDGDVIVGILGARETRDGARGHVEPVKVSERLSGAISYCHVQDSLETAFAVMQRCGRDYLPVVDGDNRLVGSITLDMIQQVARNAPLRREHLANESELFRRAAASGVYCAKGSLGRPKIYSIRPVIR